MRRPLGRSALLLAAGLLLVGCGSAGGGARSSSPVQPTRSGVAATVATASGPTSSPAASAPSCPVTVPGAPFVPPPPAPPSPAGYYHAAWYGTRSLWTMLGSVGERWHDLPKDAHGFGQKTFWWSASWDPKAEPQPAISVRGKRLDAPGSFATDGLGTNATADFGVAMLIGVSVPAAGCWELTGTYRDASLSYVVRVDG